MILGKQLTFCLLASCFVSSPSLFRNILVPAHKNDCCPASPVKLGGTQPAPSSIRRNVRFSFSDSTPSVLCITDWKNSENVSDVIVIYSQVTHGSSTLDKVACVVEYSHSVPNQAAIGCIGVVGVVDSPGSCA